MGFGFGALALVAGSVLSAAVIAVAWLLVRPVLSAVVLGLALTVAFAVWRLRARKSALALE